MSFNRLFPDDEELGKKDDDFRPDNHTLTNDIRHSGHSSSSSIPSLLSQPRMRRRRIILLVGVLLFAYVFFKNIPTDLTPVGDLIDSRDPGRTIRGRPVQPVSNDLPKVVNIPKAKDIPIIKDLPGLGKKPERTGKAELPKELSPEDIPAVLRGSERTLEHYYNGVLKFYELPASLHGITHTQGYREDNKNVLFVAANTKSASRLIPLACEMANYDRNHVHFAFLGRDPIKLDTLKELNGASRDCSVYWHDGRPDESEISSDARMEYSVTSALYHIQTFMHPQVYITDDFEEEERWFANGLRAHAARVGKSLVDLPVDAAERMMWITRLDHASLAAWDSVYVDILIHVPPNTSGSLVRLLKSISEADYFGARRPHLTIELPPKVETATQRFLDNFLWPPLPKSGGKHTSQVTLRRRISKEHLSPMDASIRLVESFYSARPRQSHVLLLSTQVELSPIYYHYLFYNTLEYGYSIYSKGTPEQEALMGIALDLPSVKLNGEDPLRYPTASAVNGPAAPVVPETPFYWQAPDTHAALYFGNKWQEFHDFLSRRLTPVSEKKEKLVSPVFPAFAEPMLELMRARCWFMLYPHLPDGNSIATVHNELSAPPEEYQEPESTASEPAKAATLTKDTPYLEPVDIPGPPKGNREGPLLHTQLVQMLPHNGDLPELVTLPLLAWDAEDITLNQAVSAAGKFAADFHKIIGRCTGTYTALRLVNTVDDLFCDDSETTPDAKAAVAQEIPPVRAGVEAAIAAQENKTPNKLKIESEKPNTKSGNEVTLDNYKSVPNERLAASGLVFDASEAPESVGGGFPIRKGPAKDGVSKEGTETERQAKAVVQSQLPDSISADEKAAMQSEFKAHLDRLNTDPSKMQEKVEEKISKAAAAGKDKAGL